jgi:hypothetical protein
VQFAALTGSLSQDAQLGMIVNYAKMFCFVKLVLTQIKNNDHNMSTTTANSTDQDDYEKRSTVGKLYQKQVRKKAHYRMKRLGYLNEANVVEFYDSFADLIKVTGSELNAK